MKKNKKQNLARMKYLLECEECGIKYEAKDTDYRMNLRKENCKNCDPSTSDKKYRYDVFLGWIADYLEGRCQICNVKIFYTNPLTKYKRCLECNPSNKHNIYSYNENTGNYELESHKVWNNYLRVHSRIKVNYDDEEYKCLHCEAEKIKEDNLDCYKLLRKEIVIPSNNEKVSNITFEGIFYSATSLDRDTVSIIKGYFGPMVFNDCNFAPLNLSGLDLSGYSFNNCIFSGSTMTETKINNTKFIDCKMIKTNLARSTISETDFLHCNLSGSNLGKTVISNTIISFSTLVYTRFDETFMSRVTFLSPNLKEARFRNSSCGRCKFISADLKDTVLSKVSFLSCEMKSLVLTDKDLSSIVFDGCDLENAHLLNCNLSETKLIKCSLSRTILGNVNAKGAIFDGSTFDQTILNKGDFRKASFLDTIIRSPDLRAAKFRGAIFTGPYQIADTVFDFAASKP